MTQAYATAAYFVAHGDLSPLLFPSDVIDVLNIYVEQHGKALMKESMPMSGIYIGKKRQKIFGDGSAARSLYRCAKPRTQQRCQAVHNLSNATVRKKRGPVVAPACDTPGMKAV